MKTVTLTKPEYEQMQRELEILRNNSSYRRLLQFEKNITTRKKVTRKDLGF